MKTINLLLAAAILFGAVSCKKEFDAPPVTELPVGNILTISDIKRMYTNGGNQAITFTDDYSVYASATTDESSGNFYKEVYVQDDSSAIQLRLDFSGGIYEGDSVRIALKGTTIDMYRGMFQLADVDVDNNIVKQATDKHVAPTVLTIPEITTDLLKYQGMLVQIENVEFDIDVICNGSTWSDSENQSDVNHTLLDCNSSPLTVRSSGYANFADELVPSGNGSLIAIVGIYSSDANSANWTWEDAQMYIREPGDLTLTGDRCTSTTDCPYLSKNFEDGSLTSGGWTTQLVTGTLNWTIGTIGGSYANMSNYNGSSNEINETWLISPAVDLSASTTPSFSFKNAYNYSGAAIEAMVSTDYSGTGDPNAANWTSAPFTLSSGGFAWVNSGNINMGAYQVSSVYVAFKYTGSASDGSTWEIDDIKIEEL